MWFKMLKEDSMQIPTHRSWILRFRPDSPDMGSNAHQCLKVSNSSRLHPSGRSLEFEKKSDFLLRHIYGKIAAFVWKTGQHRPDAILNKARHGEELQSFGR